jgi:hypothetical protein
MQLGWWTQPIGVLPGMTPGRDAKPESMGPAATPVPTQPAIVSDRAVAQQAHPLFLGVASEPRHDVRIGTYGMAAGLRMTSPGKLARSFGRLG